MKQFKFVSYLLVAVLCLGFSSCSSDDDDYEINEENLAGTWQLTHTKGWKIEFGEKNEWDRDETHYFNAISIKIDEKSSYISGEGDDREELILTWELKGDRFVYTIPGNTSNFTVRSLSAKHLVLIEDYSEYYYNELTYTRIGK